MIYLLYGAAAWFSIATHLLSLHMLGFVLAALLLCIALSGFFAEAEIGIVNVLESSLAGSLSVMGGAQLLVQHLQYQSKNPILAMLIIIFFGIFIALSTYTNLGKRNVLTTSLYCMASLFLLNASFQNGMIRLVFGEF